MTEALRLRLSLVLPSPVLLRHAPGARAIAGSYRNLLVEEEDAAPDIAAPRNRASCPGAVESPVDLASTVAAEGPGNVALVGPPVAPDQSPGPAHKEITRSAAPP